MGSIFYGVGINGKRRFGSGMYQFAIEDTWFDSAVAFTKFKNGKMSEIRIYPLTVVMGSGPMASSMRLAAGADAQRILTRLQQDSAPFGTSIDIEKGVGIIRGSKR